MIDDPVRVLVEETRTGMDVDLLVVHKGAVTFLGILTTGMDKETCTDGLPDLGVVLVGKVATLDHW